MGQMEKSLMIVQTKNSNNAYKRWNNVFVKANLRLIIAAVEKNTRFSQCARRNYAAAQKRGKIVFLVD